MKLINENQLKNIVIIGGSHSGFAVAWLMLNGPATYNRNNSLGERSANYKLPSTQPLPNPNCKQCCSCEKPKGKDPKEVIPKCFCVCKCLGYF